MATVAEMNLNNPPTLLHLCWQEHKNVLTLVVRKYVSKLTSPLKSISKVFLGFLLRDSFSG